MKLGFTGTRHGMTAAQIGTFRWVVRTLGAGGLEFHHGDCVGADQEAHGIAMNIGFRVVTHPPSFDKLRAFCNAHEIRDPRPYMVRNRAIVDETAHLIACPREANARDAGGTWRTYAYARSIGRPVTLILPDGTTRDMK